jgi:outer membrane receptor protein involved in Fe transport
MRNLSATIDYFQIKIDQLISFVDPNVIIQQCITSGALCNLIHRDTLGTLWLLPSGFVTATNINIGGLKTSGLDFTVNYTHPIGQWGSLGFNFAGTYLEKLITNNGPGLGEYDCVKYYGQACGTPNPEWRHRLRTTWSTPWNLDAALTWRHFDKVSYSGLSSNPLLTASSNPVDQVLGQRDYFDISASWAFSKQITVRGGVNNIFDKDPPMSSLVGAGFGNGNTFPQVYDALGRKVFAAVVVKW